MRNKAILGVLFYLMLHGSVFAQDVTYQTGSTAKIEQLVGDFDRSTDVRDSTRNKTFQRFGMPNTDLGVPFEHKGVTYVAFGDILFGDGDPMGITTDTDASDGIDLDFVSNAPGTHVKIDIPGVDLGGFGVPIEGVSWNNDMYLYASNRGMADCVLAKSTDDGRTFTKLYDVSDYKFINLSLEKWESTAEFPEPLGTDIQVMFGSGAYRRSSVFLAYQTAASIESKNMKYYAGFQGGSPIWVDEESKAIPVFDQPCVGELSVTYNNFLEKWVATYNCPSFTGKNGENFERGVNCRTSDNPWGPWSDPFLIYTPTGNEGILGYCQMMHRDWNQSVCDTIQDPGRDYEFGGTYGPYQFGNLATGVPGSETTIYYTLSLWNPYTVILMESTLLKAGSSPPMSDTPMPTDMVPTVQAPLSDGLYTIQGTSNSFLDNSIALEFKNNNVTTAFETGYDAQKWQLTLLADNYYSISNESSGQALTVENNDLENRANIVVEAYVGSDNQQWQIHVVGDNYRIIAKSSGKSLMMENDFKFNGTGGEIRTNSKPNLLGNVVQSSYSDDDQFQWVFTSTTTVNLTDIAIGGNNFLYNLDVGEVQTAEIGSITPANATAVLPYWSSNNTNVVTIDSVSGRMVGMSQGSAVITLTSGGITATRNVNVTNLPSVSTPLEDGFYTISAGPGADQRIDNGFSTYLEANPNVIWREPTDGLSQVWEFVVDNDGYYTIFSSTSRDTVLAISNGVIKPLGNLELAPHDILGLDPHQKWQLQPEGSAFRIISKFSGLSLEAQQASPGPIKNVRQAYWSSFQRQEWMIEPAEVPDNNITSTENFSDVRFKLFPNPVSSSVNIDFENSAGPNEQAVFVMNDLNGRQVINRELTLNGSRLEILMPGNLQPGLYLFRFYLDSQLIAMEKLLVQKD